MIEANLLSKQTSSLMSFKLNPFPEMGAEPTRSPPEFVLDAQKASKRGEAVDVESLSPPRSIVKIGN